MVSLTSTYIVHTVYKDKIDATRYMEARIRYQIPGRILSAFR